MPSDITEPQENPLFNNPRVTIPTEIVLSLATGPLLLGILASKAALELLQGIGAASEEVFRGDRLPILDFPDTQPNSHQRRKDAETGRKLR